MSFFQGRRAISASTMLFAAAKESEKEAFRPEAAPIWYFAP
jgi:hypothetical protein